MASTKLLTVLVAIVAISEIRGLPSGGTAGGDLSKGVGQFSFVQPDGTIRKLTYTADQNGFAPNRGARSAADYNDDKTPYSSSGTDKNTLLHRKARQFGYGGYPGGGYGGGLGISSSGAQASAGSSSFNGGGFSPFGGGFGGSNSFANANSFSTGGGFGRKK